MRIGQTSRSHVAEGTRVEPLDLVQRVTVKHCCFNLVFCVFALACYVPILQLASMPFIFIGTKLIFLGFALFSLFSAFPWFYRLFRVIRSGPFDVRTPNTRATPEQRRFERKFGLILVTTILTSTGLALLILNLFSDLATTWAFTPIEISPLLLAAPAHIYARRTRKRLRKEAEANYAKVLEAQNAAPAAASGAIPIPQTGHWWTQSALRDEPQAAQKVQR